MRIGEDNKNNFSNRNFIRQTKKLLLLINLQSLKLIANNNNCKKRKQTLKYEKKLENEKKMIAVFFAKSIRYLDDDEYY